MADQFETELLEGVDQLVENELRGRFGGSESTGSAAMPTESLATTMDELVTAQASQWSEAIASVQNHWQQWTAEQGESMGEAMSLALVSAMEKQTEVQRQQWQQWQELLKENAQLLAGHQEKMNQQSALLGRVMEATGEVSSLEQALNSNLNHLQETRQFEDAVISLSAAIQLLSTRISGGSNSLDLKGDGANRGKAA